MALLTSLSPSILLPLVSLLLRVASATKSSSGCGISHDYVGESTTRTFDAGSSAGGDRNYIIRLPSDYDEDTALPLMIAYHGAGDTPENFESKTHLADEDVNPNMIVVFPEGVDGYWQGADYADPSVSDKVFTTELVDRIKENYCVDEDRVYAVGKSNGGGFVGTLACSPDHGGQFAAFVAVAGAFYTDVDSDSNCYPARSEMAIMEVHGDADEEIPYYHASDGNGGSLPAIPDWVDRWASRDSCEGDGPTSTIQDDLGDDIEDELFTCGGTEGMLRHVKLEGHDHSYPGPDDSQVYITPVIVDWLNEWSLS